MIGRTWAPAYVSASDLVINGNGHTISNMTVNGKANQGFIGVAYQDITINDLTFMDAKVNSTGSFVGTVIGWTWGANSVTFDGCTFNGNSKAILAHGTASTVININNCKFAATEKGYTGAGDNTAVVEMDPITTNTYTINFTGENTITDSYAGWTRVKDGSTGHVITGLN